MSFNITSPNTPAPSATTAPPAVQTNPFAQMVGGAAAQPTPAAAPTTNAVADPPSEPTPEELFAQYFPDRTPPPPEVLRQQVQAQQMLYQQQLATLEEQNRRYEEAMFEQYLQALPAEQQDVARHLYAQQVALQQAQRQLNAQNAYINQLHQQYNPLERERALSMLSEKFGIDRTLLDQYARTPQEAEAVIGALIALRKTQNFQMRAAQGNDQVAATSGQAGGALSYDDVKAKFRNTGKIADFMRELEKHRLL